jgi:hypothetical protein
MARAPRTIKVCLVNDGDDFEATWAADLGPAKHAPRGSRRVRLVNVCFLHAKPTWGDVIVVSPVEDGLLTWDGRGVAWSKIGTRIAEDGGRHAMIVDYVPDDPSDGGEAAFDALSKACEEGHADLNDAEIVCEGAFGPTGATPGRAYLAVKNALKPSAVMKRLRAAGLPCTLLQVHPTPRREPAGDRPAGITSGSRRARSPARRRSGSPSATRKAPSRRSRSGPGTGGSRNA